MSAVAPNNTPTQSLDEIGPDLRVFAFDHRARFQEMVGADKEKIAKFKQLCLSAALAVQGGGRGYGILCDERLGHDALTQAMGEGLWIGRPVEWPGSRPLVLEPEVCDDFSGLKVWPKQHTVKCLCFCHLDDDAQMWNEQQALIKSLYAACEEQDLEFLLEVIPSKVGAVDDDTTAKIVQRFYDLGVMPDWWKLEPFKTVQAWQNVCDVIQRNDPHVRGIVVLGRLLQRTNCLTVLPWRHGSLWSKASPSEGQSLGTLRAGG
jgi:5-dehydro-2-deoxygluconokinase